MLDSRHVSTEKYQYLKKIHYLLILFLVPKMNKNNVFSY